MEGVDRLRTAGSAGGAWGARGEASALGAFTAP